MNFKFSIFNGRTSSEKFSIVLKCHTKEGKYVEHKIPLSLECCDESIVTINPKEISLSDFEFNVFLD